jgi:thioredoxin reductase
MAESPNQEHAVYDVAIVGGGPAGLSAGIWLARYLHSVVLIDSGDPRNWETRGVNGFLGQPSVRPSELRRAGREECRKYGVELIDAHVATAKACSGDRFELTLSDSRVFRSRRLLLAYGLKDVWPEVEGLEHAYGDTAHVCPDCDGYEARDKKIVVIGTGRRAVGMALNLTTWSSDVAICTNGKTRDIDAALQRKLDALHIPVYEAPIEKLHLREWNLRSLRFTDGTSLGCEKVFFSIGQHPADDLAEQLGCERDEQDHILVDRRYHTSVWNVYAAGDIVPGPQLAISAASDGAIAALAMHKSLVPPSRKL